MQHRPTDGIFLPVVRYSNSATVVHWSISYSSVTVIFRNIFNCFCWKTCWLECPRGCFHWSIGELDAPSQLEREVLSSMLFCFFYLHYFLHPHGSALSEWCFYPTVLVLSVHNDNNTNLSSHTGKLQQKLHCSSSTVQWAWMGVCVAHCWWVTVMIRKGSRWCQWWLMLMFAVFS